MRHKISTPLFLELQTNLLLLPTSAATLPFTLAGGIRPPRIRIRAVFFPIPVCISINGQISGVLPGLQCGPAGKAVPDLLATSGLNFPHSSRNLLTLQSHCSFLCAPALAWAVASFSSWVHLLGLALVAYCLIVLLLTVWETLGHLPENS